MIGHKNNKTKGTNNAPIPEDNEQYCFRMPLKLEVHKRYWTTQSLRQFCRKFFTVNALRQLTMAFAANLCGSSVANFYGECLITTTDNGFCCESLRQFCRAGIFYGECLTTTDNGFCCESLRQFRRESFTANALRQLTMAFVSKLYSY